MPPPNSVRPSWSHGSQYAADDIPADMATLWFAGKLMLPGKKLSDYLGRHEKTKAVVKLQKKGQGAPAREAVRLAEELSGL